MRFIILLLTALILSGCTSRSARYYGFGTRPDIGSLHASIISQLESYLFSPDSLKTLVIAKPEPGCTSRGPGRRDVCGFKTCFQYTAANMNGFPVLETQEFWITKGYGNFYRPSQTCPAHLIEWDGKEDIAHGDFCSLQPDHPSCKSGTRGPAPEDLRPPDNSPSPPQKTAFEQYKAKRLTIWRQAEAEDLAALAKQADLYLKDGLGARYRSVKVGDKEDAPGTKQYCGLINAKNSYGGYTGFRKFYFAEIGFMAIEDEYNGSFIDKHCR